MKIQIVPSVLLLGAAATAAIPKRSSAINRIHQYGEDAAKRVSSVHQWRKAAKATKASSADELIVTTVAPMESSADELVATTVKPLASSVDELGTKTVVSKSSERSAFLSPDEVTATPKASKSSFDRGFKVLTPIIPKASKKSADRGAKASAPIVVKSKTSKASKKSADRGAKAIAPIVVKSKTSKKFPDRGEEVHDPIVVTPKASKKSADRGDEDIVPVALPPKASKKSAFTSPDEVIVMPKSLKTPVTASPKTSKKSALTSPDEPQSPSPPVTALPKASKKSAFTSPDEVVVRPKLLKPSPDRLDEDFSSMSYDMSYDFDLDPDYDDFDPSFSMDFSFDFSLPSLDPVTTVIPPVTTVIPPVTTTTSSGPTSDWDLGRTIFEYMSACTGLELDVGSCLVDRTIDELMSVPHDDIYGRSLRFLQPSSRKLHIDQASSTLRLLTDDKCPRPDINRQDMHSIMYYTRQECIAEGFDDVSDEEFEMTLVIFMRHFAHNECWESLCGEGTDASELFFNIMIHDAAQCAGVDLDIHECAMEHLIELILLVGTEEQDTEPCNQPSEADFSFFVSFMLIDAEAKCREMGITLESSELTKASSDLVTIFTASQCWGIDDCNEQTVVHSFDGYDWPTESPVYDDEKGNRFFENNDGYQCIYEIDTEPDLERDIELSFFYQIETASADGSSLEETLNGIEAALIHLACDDRRKTRALTHTETIVAAVESSPEDVVSSDYTCSADHPDATSCHVVDGKVTLIVEGESTEYDGEIEMGAYEKFEEMFADLPAVLGDPNVVAVQYIGTEPPSTPSSAITLSSGDASPPDSTTEDAAADTLTTAKLDNAEEGGSSIFPALLIAGSAGLLAMAFLIGGFHRMNNKKNDDEMADTISSIADDKSKDGSNDGQSTSYLTADLTLPTCDHGCDHSDISSLPSPAPSPARSVGPFSPDAHRNTPAKFFVLAEEEDVNWRELSILPALAQDDGTLEDVSEEGEFVNSVSSTGSGEFSV
eukprot:CAMPEP_0183746738 /NCGR_PEP_ID=MMETSP0737-20130205/66908_1 /TAXON_ID=385413 /ORGANISM="Thalassiosira miniscula, Strain CCMP1093" /LENGTH=998 /DNA_ID=CAMNT_0025982441 /DNA_START=123 /DNA_END=3119 /DNA_ORIENTATION=+